MKVVQFVHGYPPEFIGGTESYTQALSHGLVERQHSCLVVAGSEWPCPEPSIALREDRGVAIARLIGLPRRGGVRPSTYDPLVEPLIRKALDWWRPQLVHLHHWSRLTNNLVAICRELEIPTVVTLHDQWIACSRYHRIRVDEVFCVERMPPCASCVDRDAWQSPEEIEWELRFQERMIRQELQLADRLLVPSQAQQAFLRAIAGVPLERLEVVPLGSPRVGSKRVDHGEPPSVSGPIKVGYWGYLLPEKGVHLLLEAARKLSKGMAVEWHVYGSALNPAYQARLTQLADGLEVMFHGRYSFRDLQSAALDLAVFPSLCCETYSFVLDEAFQLGLPVIAADRGAFRERLGNAGLLFECSNVGDLVAKLESILESPMALSRLKREAAEGKVVSMEDHVGRMEKIYQEAVDSYVPGPAADQAYREVLLHQRQQLVNRDLEIERLLKCVAGLERELQVTQDHLDQEREWWQEQARRLQEEQEQARRLQDEYDRLRRTPLHQLHILLSKLK